MQTDLIAENVKVKDASILFYLNVKCIHSSSDMTITDKKQL